MGEVAEGCRSNWTGSNARRIWTFRTTTWWRISKDEISPAPNIPPRDEFCYRRGWRESNDV